MKISKDLCYDDEKENYLKQVGGTRFKFKAIRNAKKALIWYFNDRFSVTLNVLGLFWMVI